MESSRDLEAKLVVLGPSGVGKTCLLTRYIQNTFHPPSATAPTIGATFLTKRLVYPDTHPPTTIRLQIWDTAGQERFRSISQLYYRGANAAILCYDITSEASFVQMGTWMAELRRNCGDECVIHVVGTKADLVAADPRTRAVAFERCIQYIAENLYTPGTSTTTSNNPARSESVGSTETPVDPRSSGFWGMDRAWDSCHEISAKDGEGVDELFHVIARRLVEQRDQTDARLAAAQQGGARTTGALEDGRADYFDGVDKMGSFRIGIGDKRRSWLGFPSVGSGDNGATGGGGDTRRQGRSGRCC